MSIINLKKIDNQRNREVSVLAFEELEIDQLLQIKPQYISGSMLKFKAIDFFTADINTIAHRLSIFEDLLACKELYQLFVDILPMICSLREFTQRQEEPYTFIEYLYDVRQVQLYIDCVTQLHETLGPFLVIV